VLALTAAIGMTVVVAGRGSRFRALLAASGLAVVAIVFFVAFAPPDIKERITQTLPGQVPNTEGRSTIWQVGWRMFEAEPVRGVGLGGFQTSSIHYVLEPGTLERTDQVIDQPLVAHNIYLQTAAELGVVGLGLLLTILIFPMVCAARAARNFARRHDRQMDIRARALIVALVAVLTSNFFLSSMFSKQLWLLVAIGPAMYAVSRRAQSEDETARA
jgi:O-antigen ligase